jgi:pyrimidine deaminase RibD-like protein
MRLKFFEIARRLSHKSDYDVHKLGAVITRGNQIVGLGFNKKKTHPLSSTRFNNIHAELSAILNSGIKNLSGCSIYVYRETKSGDLAMARPCVDCLKLLKKSNVAKIFYSTETGFKTEIIW